MYDQFDFGDLDDPMNDTMWDPAMMKAIADSYKYK